MNFIKDSHFLHLLNFRVLVSTDSLGHAKAADVHFAKIEQFTIDINYNNFYKHWVIGTKFGRDHW